MADKHPLWDLPTRFFHWALVLCIGLSWWTGDQGELDRHAWVGYVVLVLVVFRIAWGFVGSRHSRFSDFLAGPGAILAYLRGEGGTSPGHNPLGGWSVLIMLLLLLTQAVTGLFNTDDVLFNGPLYYALDGDLRDTLGVIHEVAFDILLAFIVLHILAVCWHQFVRGEPLLQAMTRGEASGRTGRQALAPTWLALVLSGAIALLLWAIIAFAPQPTVMW